MVDLDELEKLAKAATPGPWTIEKEYHRCYLTDEAECNYRESPLTERTVYRKSEGDLEDAFSHEHESYEAHRISPDVAGNFDYEEGGIIQTADAEFIAAANPQAVLELIELVRKAERAHRTVAKLYGKVTAERDAALARIAEAAKLHRRRDDLEYRWGGGPVCDGCGDEDGWASKWPCPTAVSLGLNEGDER